MKNNSMDFVKKRIASGECNGMENNHYFSITENSFVEIFKSNIGHWDDETNSAKFKLINVKIDNIMGTGTFNIEIKYEPDAKFEYFTMKRYCCDGTFFYNDLANIILQKLLWIGTYNINNIPSDFYENPFKYDIKYTVGDFVFATEYDEKFATKEKSWMNERQTVMLPIKCEWTEKGTISSGDN